MISYNTRNGSVNLSNKYFADLIGNAVSTCYGVVGMRPHGIRKIVDKFVNYFIFKNISIIYNMMFYI